MPRFVEGQESVAIARRLSDQKYRQGVGLSDSETIAFAPVMCSDMYLPSEFVRDLGPGQAAKK
jgi:hypothetical protein